MTLPQLTVYRNTKSAELGAIFDKAKTGDVDENQQPIFDLGLAGAAPSEIKERNDELTKVGEMIDEKRSTDEAYKSHQALVRAQAQTTNTFGGGKDGLDLNPDKPAVKSFSEKFVESDAYKSWKETKAATVIKIEGSLEDLLEGGKPAAKATLTTSAGYLPPTLMDTRVVLSAQRRPVIMDLIPSDDTNQMFIPYIVESTFTNNAAAVTEGAVKPESAFVFTRVVVQMAKIATTLPVTQEQLMFVNQIDSLLRNRLGFQVKLEQEREVLLGSGTPPEMRGIQNTVGIQTQAQGADDVFTALLKAITKVQSTVGFADPTGIVLHPNNFLTARTLKDTLGRFIMGSPDEVGPTRLWGLPIISTIAETAGTGLVGDFATYSHIDNGLDLTIQVGYINDDFTRNIVRLLAEIFSVVEVYRPTAFCTVTGLA